MTRAYRVVARLRWRRLRVARAVVECAIVNHPEDWLEVEGEDARAHLHAHWERRWYGALVTVEAREPLKQHHLSADGTAVCTNTHTGRMHHETDPRSSG